MNKITILGIGGQGVITIGKLMATGFLLEGFSPALIISKGSTQTGGPVRCDIRLSSSHNIYDAVFSNRIVRDWLILDESMKELITSKGTVWINSGYKYSQNEYNIDADQLGRESGKKKGMNLVLLGFYLAFNQTISLLTVEKALLNILPQDNIDECLELLRIGYQNGVYYH